MKKYLVMVVKLDEEHRLYFYKQKILYKERKSGKLKTVFSGLTISDLLGSSLVSDDTKKRMREMFKD